MRSVRLLIPSKTVYKFWSDQEVLYDYKTDLQGTGNRSIV